MQDSTEELIKKVAIDKSGAIKIASKNNMPARMSNLVGWKFNRLTVLCLVGQTPNKTNIWGCICDCGKYHTANSNSLKTGVIKSCGCLNKENPHTKTHGLSKTRIYKIWCMMNERCKNPSNNRYDRYGGRGISVCDRWKSFDNFYADMSPTYLDGLSIDRINNDGDYCKENCKWSTSKEQCINRSTTYHVDIDGDVKTIEDWSKISGINSNLIRERLKRHTWSNKEAVFEPAKKSGYKWKKVK